MRHDSATGLLASCDVSGVKLEMRRSCRGGIFASVGVVDGVGTELDGDVADTLGTFGGATAGTSLTGRVLGDGGSRRPCVDSLAGCVAGEGESE